ncbi:MAG TPA: hypothetical protein VM680_17005 [Verrucomicrobiae bacterium]|nr:hypothetical protein [Verrucomicrobiae bacterium]
MPSRPGDKVVKTGFFLYGGSARCDIKIVQTDFRPGVDDDQDPIEDAYGEFYEVNYSGLGAAGGGSYDSLTQAMQAVETIVKDVTWEDDDHRS